jgi:hypothetical protein
MRLGVARRARCAGTAAAAALAFLALVLALADAAADAPPGAAPRASGGRWTPRQKSGTAEGASAWSALGRSHTSSDQGPPQKAASPRRRRLQQQRRDHHAPWPRPSRQSSAAARRRLSRAPGGGGSGSGGGLHLAARITFTTPPGGDGGGAGPSLLPPARTMALRALRHASDAEPHAIAMGGIPYEQNRTAHMELPYGWRYTIELRDEGKGGGGWAHDRKAAQTRLQSMGIATIAHVRVRD